MSEYLRVVLVLVVVVVVCGAQDGDFYGRKRKKGCMCAICCLCVCEAARVLGQFPTKEHASVHTLWDGFLHLSLANKQDAGVAHLSEDVITHDDTRCAREREHAFSHA